MEYRAPLTPMVPPGEMQLLERDMTVIVSAAMTLAELQRRLALADQWLPIDGDPARPVGQLVDQNSTGPLRLGYGAWRDLLLGVQFRNRRGELISAGGRTVKNVAGYDLTKFIVGQHGQFGEMLTLTTRTYRRPAGAILATFEPGPSLVNELLPSPLKPQWVVETPSALLCGYLGDRRFLEFMSDRLPRLKPGAVESRSLEDDERHRQSQWCAWGERSFRASVPPAQTRTFAASARLKRWSADAVFGVVVGPVAAGEMRSREAEIRVAAEAAGGSVRFDGQSENEASASNPVERAILDRLVAAFGGRTND